jgi:hypothetical protein
MQVSGCKWLGDDVCSSCDITREQKYAGSLIEGGVIAWRLLELTPEKVHASCSFSK